MRLAARSILVLAAIVSECWMSGAAICDGSMNPPPSRREEARAITAGERAWGQAYVTGNVRTVQRLLADDFTGVDPHGNRYDKTAVLKDVARSDHATSDEVGPIAIRFYGDTAIAQAHETQRGPAPKRRISSTVFTDTWVKSGNRWQIVAAEDLDPHCGRK